MALLGDIKKLPNGNYMTSWTEIGTIMEITPDHEIAWRIEADLGAATTRITWFEDIYTMQ